MLLSSPSRSSCMLFLTGAMVWFVSCIDVATCFMVLPAQCHHCVSKLLNGDRDGNAAILKNSNPSCMQTLEVVDHKRFFPTGMQVNIPSPQMDRAVLTEDSHLSQGTQSSPTESWTLVPLNFDNDIKKLIDIEKPYYALKNEHSVIDSTGESVGFVCTFRREMPISRENGGISFGEVGRHTAASATVAAALKNPKRGRFHYLASDYTCDVGPLQGVAKKVIPKALDGSGDFLTNLDEDEFIIFCACNELTKRAAHCDIYLETKDTTWHVNIEMSLVSAALFNKKYPPVDTGDENSCRDCNPYASIDGRCLENKKWYPDLMLFHNGDLIGEAIARLTNRNIPYKKKLDAQGTLFFEHRDREDKVSPKHTNDIVRRSMSFNKSYGIKMRNWECQPQNLNIADSEGLELQVRTYLRDGAMGEPGSTYCAECLVKENVSGLVCYEATGTFSLDQVH
ncbi:hypothetical protein HJC23_001215 [Cyclotella cryptica]|uniref:Uncharacterized protein n=1 Tax=Cyclotella cryptica TaxID=29204 RepID=A0ABD3QN25_9STRA